jgi:SAM-dependent methyltransferase
MEANVNELKRVHRRTWAAGDYSRVAELVQDPATRLVDAVGIERGMDVLDVAAGTGNVAIPAAQLGARVTGLDLTPELFDVARERAASAGVEVEWIEADAEEMPFDDGRFDRVLSALGVMFTPRHEVMAAELARVTRPDGVIGVVNWTPEGFVGQLFALLGGYTPPPPSYASPPPLWGDEAHVRKLFAESGVELEFERRMAPQPFESAEDHVRYFETHYGPVVMARERLAADGTWDEVRAKYLELVDSFARTPEGGFGLEFEYLLAVGRKPA